MAAPTTSVLPSCPRSANDTYRLGPRLRGRPDPRCRRRSTEERLPLAAWCARCRLGARPAPVPPRARRRCPGNGCSTSPWELGVSSRQPSR